MSIIDAEDSTNFEDIVVKWAIFLYLWAQWLILTLCNSNRLLQSILRYSTTLNLRQAAAVSPQETKFLQSLLKKTYLVVDKVSTIYFLWCVFDMIENIVTWTQNFTNYD